MLDPDAAAPVDRVGHSLMRITDPTWGCDRERLAAILVELTSPARGQRDRRIPDGGRAAASGRLGETFEQGS